MLETSANKLRLFYNSTRFYYLNESSPDLDQPLQLLNPIYATLAENIRATSGELDKQNLQMLISSVNRLAERFNESLLTNQTAREALVGRRCLLIEKARKLASTFGFDPKIPPELNADRFGYVGLVNASWLGPFEIYTGYQISQPSLGELISFKGRRRMVEFEGRCNRLQSSAGELRPMPLKDRQVLEMFSPSLCRIVRLLPTGERKQREGQTVSYAFAADDFASAQKNPENQCFCINSTADNYCSLSGVVELAPCSYYSPIVVNMAGLELDKRITDSIANWDSELVSSELESIGKPDLSCQLLLQKRVAIPIRGDITVTIFMKVQRDAQFR